MHRNFLIGLFALLAGIAPASQAASGFDPSSIEEDASAVEELLDWPVSEFPPASERAQSFKPGETFTFRAQWGLFRKAGEMVMSTRLEETDTGPKFIVRTQTHSRGLIRALYPLTMDANATLDTEHWRLARLTVTGETRSKESDTLTEFDFASGTMNYTDKKSPDSSKTGPIPYPIPFDYASGLLNARSWDFESGTNFPLLINSKGKFYYIEMKVAAREQIETDLGPIEAYRLEPAKAYPRSRIFAEGGRLAIWISADERRLPLRFDLKTKVGLASMRLSSYQLAGEESVKGK